MTEEEREDAGLFGKNSSDQGIQDESSLDNSLHEEKSLKEPSENVEGIDDEDGNDTLDDVVSSDGSPLPVEEDIRTLPGMYRTWFLDYASYVILERAIPHIEDGLKPVQRRVLYAMHLFENGHLHKVAKIVGQTMAYHPHGDASINDALVQLGQKGLLIDTQGNWGNILTGDEAAAGRYIEAKLSPFALEVAFDDDITEMKPTYDATAEEPVCLPVRFPLLLAQGAEGIAVGLSSKIYPHNPKELLEASIAYLENKSFELYPDFPTGGLLDVDRYNDGRRGGQLKSRARIERIGERQLSITSLPYGKTTSTLIDSILRANDKGQIKVKHIDDMTAQEADIRIQLPQGVSTDKTIDGLYAFTDCEVPLSPNACVIRDGKPCFLGISDLLKYSADRTVSLLKEELEHRREVLQEGHVAASLERIFIEERIYKEKPFEDAANETEALDYIKERILAMPDLVFVRPIKREDLKRLLEIKMARILRFNRLAHDKKILRIEKELEQVEYDITHITDYTIAYYHRLIEEYFSDCQRKTEITRFSNIEATKVIEATEKLYFDREGGFAGTQIKNGEFVAECSLLDDMIIFFRDGTYLITKIEEKKFLGGKEVIHIDRYVRNDKRTIYNVIYRSGAQGSSFIKRFCVTGMVRDKEYDLTTAEKGSRVLYFSANPNGEAETVRITLKQQLRMRNLVFEKDFSEILIKGRQSRGNLVTRASIQRITLKEKGASTLGGRKVWFDKDVLRINFDGQGTYLGEFEAGDKILVVRNDGLYYTTEVDESVHFPSEPLRVERFDPNKVWSVVYRMGPTQYPYLKRFQLTDRAKPFALQGEENVFVCMSDAAEPILQLRYGGKDEHRPQESIAVVDFVGVKGVAAKGKRLSTYEVADIELIAQASEDETEDDGI